MSTLRQMSTSEISQAMSGYLLKGWVSRLSLCLPLVTRVLHNPLSLSLSLSLSLFSLSLSLSLDDA